MSGKTKANLVLSVITVYCALSLAIMRVDYFAAGADFAAQRQFIHLLLTATTVLGLVLWKGHAIETFVGRLSTFSVRQQTALFAAVVALLFTILNYPRNRMSFHMFVSGLIESTRTLVQDMFLAVAILGLVCIISSNARFIGEALLRFAEKLIFQPRQRVFLAGVMLIVFLETNAISLFQFHHVPVCSDAVNYIFQAKIFAGGKLYVEPPQYPEFFKFVSFIMRDKWYSIVAPGFPVLLMTGVFLGAPWIVNPILAALSALLVFLAAREMYNDRIARGAAALMVVSPFFLILSSVHLSHTATAFFFLLFLYFYLKGLEGSRPLHLALAGLALGAMGLTRPLTALAASIPWAAYTAWLILRRKMRLLGAAALLFGIAIPAVSFLLYNHATNGDPLMTGYTALYGKDFRLGFVQPPPELTFARQKHTPLRGVINVNNGFYSLNRYLFGWPLPSLLFAVIPFAVPSRNKWDYLMLGHLLAIPALYFFFFHQDFLMGPRYYFTVIPAAVILTARGLQETPGLWDRLSGSKSDSTGTSCFLALLILVCVLFNVIFFFPARLEYYNISSDIHQGVPSPIWHHIKSGRISNAVVFINDFPYSLAYGTGLWRNDPDLDGDIVYVRDCGIANIHLMEQYPDRRYYRYTAVSDKFEEISSGRDSRTTPAPSGE